MRLRTAVNQYITYRRSLGEGFVNNELKLNAFVHTIGEKDRFTDVKTESVSKYLAGTSPVITTNWHAKYYALHGFYKYAISRGYTKTSPLPAVIPKRPAPFVPYIYSIKELRAIFDACLNYQINKGELKPYTVRTLLLILYGTGLRVSEALSLKISDVDFRKHLLIIRETKFHKTRLVPIGKELSHALLEYASRRRRWKFRLRAPWRRPPDRVRSSWLAPVNLKTLFKPAAA